jgi:MtrB/PioB family decaheme-associated outer membrane protein
MKTAAQLLLLSTLSVLSAAATGQAAVDTSEWKCELCKFKDGFSGAAELGGGDVSDSSAKFGEYNGLDEEGGFLIADGAARFRGADGAYWDIDASNLGLDTRSVAAEGGRQGKYSLFLNYDEIPHVLSDSAKSPFIGNGRASLTLPAGFPAATTGLMPLVSTLQPADLESKREDLGVGASFTPVRAWEFAANFRHQTRDGTKRATGAFFVNASQLVAPVDYETDQMDVSTSYTTARLQARVAYYGSIFRDSNASLTWQNPFAVPAFPDAVAGQLALPPDNEFHQISASAGYQFTDRTQATADIAFGRMTQDGAFLAPTLNTGLAVPALPRASLDGRADTLNANVELNSAVTDWLRLKASYSYNDRDNQTSQEVYSWVSTDMFFALPRGNLPYGFTQDKFKLRADFKAPAHIRASLGFDHDSVERTFQEVSTTRESTIWGTVSSRFLDKIDVTLELAHGDRDNPVYQPVATIDPPENPLLRKYNMAGRKRDSAQLRGEIAATDKINIGIQADASEDEYSDSTIGLTDGKEFSFGGDVTMMLSERTSLHLFGSRQVIESEQAGSQTFSTPDWRGENEDTIDLVAIGFKHEAIKDRLDIGVDYTATRSTGEIDVNAPAGESRFPDLSTSLNSVKLYAIYRMKNNVSLRAAYWYEDYDSDNWMLDGVAPDTIPNVLAFGELSPRYHLHVVALSVKYVF